MRTSNFNLCDLRSCHFVKFGIITYIINGSIRFVSSLLEECVGGTRICDSVFCPMKHDTSTILFILNL